MIENSKHLLETGSQTQLRPSKLAKITESSEGDLLSDDDKQQQPQPQPQPTADSHLQLMSAQNPKLQRYLVAIEYIGTRFSGSQKQPNCRTVVGVLEVSLYLMISVLFLILSLTVSKTRGEDGWKSYSINFRNFSTFYSLSFVFLIIHNL